MKILKIVFINILFLIGILIIAEIASFAMGYKMQYAFIMNKKTTLDYMVSRYFVDAAREYYDVPNKKMRPIAGENFKKNPIVLFGCSVTYGNLLKDNENFSGVLSKITKRPVYNMAGDGWTFAHMLKNLQSNPTIENINPDYIIYTYIIDQKRRLFFYQGWPHDTGLYLRYKIDRHNKLVEVKEDYPLYWRSAFVKTMQIFIQQVNVLNTEKTSKLMLRILDESVKIMKQRYPHAKLIMLLYDDPDCERGAREIYDNNYYLSQDELNAIKNMGFEIVNIEEEMGFPTCTADYKVDNHHPSAKFWNEFTPKLVKKLNM